MGKYPLRSIKRQEYLLSSIVITVVLKVLTREISEEKERNGVKSGKEEIKNIHIYRRRDLYMDKFK